MSRNFRRHFNLRVAKLKERNDREETSRQDETNEEETVLEAPHDGEMIQQHDEETTVLEESIKQTAAENKQRSVALSARDFGDASPSQQESVALLNCKQSSTRNDDQVTRLRREVQQQQHLIRHLRSEWHTALTQARRLALSYKQEQQRTQLSLQHYKKRHGRLKKKFISWDHKVQQWMQQVVAMSSSTRWPPRPPIPEEAALHDEETPRSMQSIMTTSNTSMTRAFTNDKTVPTATPPFATLVASANNQENVNNNDTTNPPKTPGEDKTTSNRQTQTPTRTPLQDISTNNHAFQNTKRNEASQAALLPIHTVHESQTFLSGRKETHNSETPRAGETDPVVKDERSRQQGARDERNKRDTVVLQNYSIAKAVNGWRSTQAAKAFVSEALDSKPTNIKTPNPYKGDLRSSLEQHRALVSTAPQWLSKKKRSVDDDEPDYKYKQVVRHKHKRQCLPGHSCPECDEFWAAVGRDYPLEGFRDASRHRGSPEQTPAGFWDLSFVDEQRQGTASEETDEI